MGKSQQKKRQTRRHNPMRVPDSHLEKGLAAASASSRKNEVILPIIQKMESVDPSERKWACVAVSNLIQNDPSTRRLLQGKNVVGALITRLSDSEEEVVIEAAGALRNLCIDGGFDICAEMYNKNILAPLKSFIPKISNTLSQYLATPKSAPDSAQELIYGFADNVITIIWCLSETSNKAMNAINQISLIPFLMSFLGARETLPASTVTSAAQCLYVLTDENPPAINELRSDAAYTAYLLSIVRPSEPALNVNGKDKEISNERALTLRVLCCGILRNISPIPPPSVAATVDLDRDVVLPTLVPVLSSVALLEASLRAQELVDKDESVTQLEKLSLKHAPKSDHKTESQIELERLEQRLRTVQSTLEILTGLCATLPDPVSPSDGPETEGDGEDEDEDMDAETDEDAVPEEDNTQLPASSAPAYFDSLVYPLLTLIQPTPLSFPPLAGPSPHPPTTSVLSAIHISALECLNNIFLSMATTAARRSLDVDAENGRKLWHEIWRSLSKVGTEISGAGQERRREMWGLAAGVLWGVGNIWKGALVPDSDQVNVLIQFCSAASDHVVKVKCIGTLECLAQHPQSIDANKTISQYLLSLLLPTSSTPTEPLLQTVSALIDIYSDETLPYDTNFRQGHYLDALVASVEGVRRAVKSIDRKKERDLRIRGEEVRDNLIAFIEYRRGLGL
ncbi:ARM repeat-containing protein [Obba rivulosa]|uniref:ARM repeat-containing protein n=1 Tax=Obba rivulosa TaxID=1052685 RepID=A0A8E2DTT7_9APHY|nr:ARM repeat-containing protein [Obba rivulosa]